MKIYLDNRCLNRPFDDLSQDRVYPEAEAILSIVADGADVFLTADDRLLRAAGKIELRTRAANPVPRLMEVTDN
jgi:hypothetical protein